MKKAAKNMLSLLDLSAINKEQSLDKIATLVSSADTPFGKVKGICVFPAFIQETKALLAKKKLTDINIISYLNVDKTSVSELISVSEQSIQDGADEIELLFPCKHFTSEEMDSINTIISTISNVVHQANKQFTIILECNEFQTEDNLKHAIEIAIYNHADFLKTSTGKNIKSTTGEILSLICKEINSRYRNHSVGIKLAGGIQNFNEASQLLEIITNHFGEQWINSNHLRFCSNGLFDDLMSTLGCSKE